MGRAVRSLLSRSRPVRRPTTSRGSWNCRMSSGRRATSSPIPSLRTNVWTPSPRSWERWEWRGDTTRIVTELSLGQLTLHHCSFEDAVALSLRQYSANELTSELKQRLVSAHVCLQLLRWTVVFVDAFNWFYLSVWSGRNVFFYHWLISSWCSWALQETGMSCFEIHFFGFKEEIKNLKWSGRWVALSEADWRDGVLRNYCTYNHVTLSFNITAKACFIQGCDCRLVCFLTC